MMRMDDASVARANGRHRRRGSVAFGSTSVRFGSTSVRFDVGSVPDRSRRRIRSRQLRSAIEPPRGTTVWHRDGGRARERGRERERTGRATRALNEREDEDDVDVDAKR